MTNVINLRQARKAKARRQKSRQAEENRVLHGLTKAQKQSLARDRARDAAAKEGLRLDKTKKPEKD